MSWVADRQTTIYSRAKAILTSKLKSKYSTLYVTEDNITPTDTQFPTVYITFLTSAERGQTLDGTTINAVTMTAEVHVKTTKAQGILTNNDVSWEVVEAFKTMGFIATIPNIPVSNIDGVYESVSRFSRLVAQGDVI